MGVGSIVVHVLVCVLVGWCAFVLCVYVKFVCIDGPSCMAVGFFYNLYVVYTAVQVVQMLCVHAVGYCGRWSPAVLKGSVDKMCGLLVGCLSCGR